MQQLLQNLGGLKQRTGLLHADLRGVRRGLNEDAHHRGDALERLLEDLDALAASYHEFLAEFEEACGNGLSVSHDLTAATRQISGSLEQINARLDPLVDEDHPHGRAEWEELLQGIGDQLDYLVAHVVTLQEEMAGAA